MTAPRFCYLVLCHTRTDAVVRLVRRIRRLSPTAAVVTRFGPEADLDPDLLRAAGAHVLPSPIRTAWGDWSLVAAELEAYRAVRQQVPASHYVVVSGQDYPVTDLAAWETRVADTDAVLDLQQPHPGTIDNVWRVVRGPALPAPVHRVARHLAWRLTTLSGERVLVNESPRRGDPRWWIGLPRRGPRRTVAKASQWKVLSARSVDVLLDRAEQHRDERRYVASCKVPDELYVATALSAAGSVRIVDAPTTFARFAPGASSPLWLTPELVEEAVAVRAPFARKLASDADPAVLAVADRAAERHRPA